MTDTSVTGGEGDQPQPDPDPDPDPEGAYAQFTQAQLKYWATRLAIAGGLLIVLLWLAAGRMRLFSRDVENGLANVVAVWLLAFGGVAFLIGVFLQLAALRVAKLRTADGIAEKFAVGEKEVEGIVKAIGDVLKSAKVPVAAMFVGAVLMVMGGFIAAESLDSPEPEHAAEERDDAELDVRERAVNEELEHVDRLLGELCQRLESSDVQPRRLGELGALLVELCG